MPGHAQEVARRIGRVANKMLDQRGNIGRRMPDVIVGSAGRVPGNISPGWPIVRVAGEIGAIRFIQQFEMRHVSPIPAGISPHFEES